MPVKQIKAPQRREDLIVQKLGEEVLVYDQASHRAHSLNRPAALVFDMLDGKTKVADVARKVGKALGDAPEQEIVANAVNDLASANLLKPGPALPRRAILRGLAAGLVPVVVSIAVPAAAEAGSCGTYGDPCESSSGPGCCDGFWCAPAGSGLYTCVEFPAFEDV